RQAFKREDKYYFWGGLLVEAVGAGKGLSDQQFAVAERLGVEIAYATKGIRLLQDQRGRVIGVTVQGPDGFADLHSNAVIVACGGFEANAEMRTRYLGQGWELAKVRGIPYNTGDGIRMALDIGAQPYGHWSSCHAVAWDLNAPPTGDRTITELYQKHSYPFGLIVNAEGQRFVDEGADFRNYTYAKYGREILQQPLGMAVQIFDDKVKHLLRDEYRIDQVTKAETQTIEELADQLGINREGLLQTIKEYNAAVHPAEYNPRIQRHHPGRQTHVGDHAAEVQLGTADCHPALPRFCRDLWYHVYLWRVAYHRARASAGYRGQPDARFIRRWGTGRRTVLLQLSR